MKVFDKRDPWPTKVNFVDENNVMLGYDLEQDCCEYADWFISSNVEKTVVEELTKDQYDLEGYVFDTGFIKLVEWGDSTEEALAIFRIHSGDDELFIHLYNIHNGYYSHGFDFTCGDDKISSGYL